MEKREEKKKWTKSSGRRFNGIASGLFAPLYPILASQFVTRSSIDSGICIDLGSGPGHLGIALAKSYDFKVYGLDFSDEIISLARKNIAKEELIGTVEPTLGSVDKLPFTDNFANLIISRGSVYFWDDIETAFGEIYRVLKPGGRTFIGGGFGNAKLREFIVSEMRKQDPQWECQGNKPESQKKLEQAKAFMTGQNIDFSTINDESGQWLMMCK